MTRVEEKIQFTFFLTFPVHWSLKCNQLVAEQIPRLCCSFQTELNSRRHTHASGRRKLPIKSNQDGRDEAAVAVLYLSLSTTMVEEKFHLIAFTPNWISDRQRLFLLFSPFLFHSTYFHFFLLCPAGRQLRMKLLGVDTECPVSLLSLSLSPTVLVPH